MAKRKQFEPDIYRVFACYCNQEIDNGYALYKRCEDDGTEALVAIFDTETMVDTYLAATEPLRVQLLRLLPGLIPDIAAMLDDYGESFLCDDGVDSKVCKDAASNIVDLIANKLGEAGPSCPEGPEVSDG